MTPIPVTAPAAAREAKELVDNILRNQRREKDQGAGSESTSQPHFMDDLLEAAGAENVDFPLKTACWIYGLFFTF